MPYKVKEAFKAKYPHAVTIVDGVAVAFAEKDLIVEKPGTLHEPPKKRVYPAITQDGMKYLFEVEKHPAIEVVESDAKKTGK
jgi:hypothetical protein